MDRLDVTDAAMQRPRRGLASLPTAAILALALGLGAAGPSALAQASQAGAAAAEPPLVEATVRKVDLEAGKITLRHGDIPNLNMGPMTMVFGTTDPSLLKGLQANDRIRFRAVEKNGQMLVTGVEKIQ